MKTSRKSQENLNKSKEKAENANVFLEVCLIELDQSHRRTGLEILGGGGGGGHEFARLAPKA